MNELQHVGIAATDYGSRVEGWLVAPRTGNYQFSVAGNDQVKFFLSSNESIDNLPGSPQAYIPDGGWTNVNEWTKYTTQNSTWISLTKGQRYFFRVLHKDNANGHFQVAWEVQGSIAKEIIPGPFLQPVILMPTASPLPKKSAAAPIFSSRTPTMTACLTVGKRVMVRCQPLMTPTKILTRTATAMSSITPLKISFWVGGHWLTPPTTVPPTLRPMASMEHCSTAPPPPTAVMAAVPWHSTGSMTMSPLVTPTPTITTQERVLIRSRCGSGAVRIQPPATTNFWHPKATPEQTWRVGPFYWKPPQAT
ncbi:MAG: hypothetical protein HC901_01615 [Bdellovibrionaceae bacterium]|nr:hypothetical protein [Pseudobdellovibrionaceae bacterium]